MTYKDIEKYIKVNWKKLVKDSKKQENKAEAKVKWRDYKFTKKDLIDFWQSGGEMSSKTYDRIEKKLDKLNEKLKESYIDYNIVEKVINYITLPETLDMLITKIEEEQKEISKYKIH